MIDDWTPPLKKRLSLRLKVNSSNKITIAVGLDFAQPTEWSRVEKVETRQHRYFLSEITLYRNEGRHQEKYLLTFLLATASCSS